MGGSPQAGAEGWRGSCSSADTAGRPLGVSQPGGGCPEPVREAAEVCSAAAASFRQRYNCRSICNAIGLICWHIQEVEVIGDYGVGRRRLRPY